MSRQTEELWTTLSRAGLTEGAAPATGKLGSPWYVKVLLAFSGWLAALFLLGFIAMGFEFVLENNAAALIVGGLMIGAAFAVLRIPKNEFVEHLGLAVSLAGQALVVYAVFDSTGISQTSGWLLVALLQVPLAVVMPNFVHRVFSAYVAAFALSVAMALRGWPDIVSGVVMLVAAWCWLEEFRYPRQMRRIRAIGYGLVLALIQLKGTALFGYRTMGWHHARNQLEVWAVPWFGEVLTGAVALYVVWQLLQRYGQNIRGRVAITALLGTVLLCGVSIKVQGITAGMVILVLGFAGSNSVLLGLGVVSLLFFISSYYYLLDATLLAKSLTLLIVGVVLLAVRWLMVTLLPEEKGGRSCVR